MKPRAISLGFASIPHGKVGLRILDSFADFAGRFLLLP